MSDAHDLTDLSRIVRVALLDQGLVNNPEEWTGIKSARLVATAFLDPRIA